MTVMAELVETRPMSITARKNMKSVRQGLPRFIFLVMKKRAKRRVRPVSAMTRLSRKALIRKGTMVLPQVCWKSAEGLVTPLRPISPRKSMLGQPMSTFIQR